MLSVAFDEWYDFSSPLPEKFFTGVWYVSEHARSGRSACRSCGAKIANRSLRIGIQQDVVPNNSTDVGWFHPKCLLEVMKKGNHDWCRKITKETQIKGFSSLGPLDQDSLRKLFGISAPKILPTATPAMTTLPTSIPTMLTLPTGIPTMTPLPTSIPTMTTLPTPTPILQPLQMTEDEALRTALAASLSQTVTSTPFAFSTQPTAKKSPAKKSPAKKSSRSSTKKSSSSSTSQNVYFNWDDDGEMIEASGETYPLKEVFKIYGGEWDYRNKVWKLDPESVETLLGEEVPESYDDDPDWSGQSTVQRLKAKEYEEEDDDEEEEEEDDYMESEEEEEEEEEEDSSEEEMYVRPPQPKKRRMKTPQTSQYAPAGAFGFSSASSAPSAPMKNFSTNIEPCPEISIPTPKLPFTVAESTFSLSSLSAPIPLYSINQKGGVFSGKRFYFVPGCSFSTPAAVLKKKVRDNGGTLVTTSEDATHIISVSSRVRAGFGSDSSMRPKRVVSEQFILRMDSPYSGRDENQYALNA